MTESELSSLRREVETLASQRDQAREDYIRSGKSITALNEERDRLELEIEQLVAENKGLRVRLSAMEGVSRQVAEYQEECRAARQTDRERQEALFAECCTNAARSLIDAMAVAEGVFGLPLSLADGPDSLGLTEKDVILRVLAEMDRLRRQRLADLLKQAAEWRKANPDFLR
jgi:hypothetical protein